MVERLVIVKDNDLTNEDDKDTKISTNQRISSELNEQSLEDSRSTSTSDVLPSKLDESIEKSLIKSSSIDSSNDPDDSQSGKLSKTKNKRQRKSNESINNIGLKKGTLKKKYWFSEFNCTKPLIYILVLFMIYIMWIKRDIWIYRLLISNGRIHRTSISNQDKQMDIDDSSDLSTFKHLSSSTSSKDTDDSEYESSIDEQKPSTTYDESSPANPHKLKLKTRRIKMNFNKQYNKRKHRHSKNHISDDDDLHGKDNNYNDDYDDEDDDNNNTQTKFHTEQVMTKPKKLKQSLSPSFSDSRPRYRRRLIGSRNKYQLKNSRFPKTVTELSSNDEIFKQLKKLNKSRNRYQIILRRLARKTGLKKSKLKRLIRKKDYSFLKLNTFISLLNSFRSTLLIVPK